MARVGLFGGTFDPIHIGHLILAELCREQLNLTQVDFVVSADPPHKQGAVVSAFAHRAEMVRVATQGTAGFRVDESEARRDGPSFTVDTLQDRVNRSEDELWFLIGADSLRDLASWREPERILRLARLGVVERPGVSVGKESVLDTVPGLAERVDWVESPLIELSSSVIRSRVQHGLTIRYQIPDAVLMYIEHHGLYRMDPATTPESL
jgi:nicotinate-nucleotide adenylyltransferase